ncbi:uncharacterized protein LOC101763411 isoform X2 [Setaria italica]|uniref:Uncharacterized protein n=1 Tax=Setaria italica TaxID=4555 RepID=K3YX32_SETIT|nr:uncharacterized protein LOC101763411 isoform X2 [Setaria italica]
MMVLHHQGLDASKVVLGVLCCRKEQGASILSVPWGNAHSLLHLVLKALQKYNILYDQCHCISSARVLYIKEISRDHFKLQTASSHLLDSLKRSRC